VRILSLYAELFADLNRLNNNGTTIFGNRVADSMMISRQHFNNSGPLVLFPLQASIACLKRPWSLEF
jgi:hypothetical protein